MIKLVDEDNLVGAADVEFTKAEGFTVEQLHVGFPTMHENMGNYPDAPGMFDLTDSHGSSTITLVVRISNPYVAQRRDALEALMAHCVPRARSRLYWRLNDDGNSYRTAIVRAVSVSRPVERWNTYLVSIQFSAQYGIMEASSDDVVTVAEGASDATYTTINQTGNTDAYPVLSCKSTSGTWTDPTFKNLTTGGLIVIEGLTVVANDELFIDTRTRQVYVVDYDTTPDTVTNYLHLVDHAATIWWYLQPGNNNISNQCATGTPTLTVTYRDTWI